MESRRKFLKASAAALAVAAARPAYSFQGANNRVRLAVIGCGNRSARVFDAFARQSNVQWVAGCEVNPAKLNSFMTPARQTFKLAMVEDYRRILDRNDVDAVLIGGPDFSHARMTIDAIAAGKDIYVEKPAANSIPRINAMLEAHRKGNRVIQVGTQQRSWDHFAEAKKILDAGTIGAVRHVVIMQPGSYASARQEPQPIPAGLNWDLWQLKGMALGAPERPFSPNRLAFRPWYEYGSGLIGDWGAHHIDVAHWFMNADTKVPVKTAAVGKFIQQPQADPEMVPDTFSISWEYDNFVMSFANAVIPRDREDGEGWGVYFQGGSGTLHVNRMGYSVLPPVQTTPRLQGPPPPPTAGNVQIGDAAPAAGRQGGGPGGAPGGGRGGGGRGGGAGTPPPEKRTYLNPRGGVEEDYPLDAHVQNFLACMASRQKPNADMEIGYHAALPALLALESLKTGKILGWDAQARAAKAL
jgi:predicted dehydrogenase